MHRKARLTVFGRQLLVDRVETDGWTVARAAEAAGGTRQTATKWVRRYRACGLAGLEDRSSRPGRPPRAPPGSDRAKLLHMDVKKLGRIPDGGGHRFRGRGHGTPRAHRGYDYVHQAIDDMSRVVYAAIFPDERGTTCAAFLRDAGAFFARLGVRIGRVMTDNAKNYTRSRAFAEALAELEARHLTTQPFRPQTTGKAARGDPLLVRREDSLRWRSLSTTCP